MVAEKSIHELMKHGKIQKFIWLSMGMVYLTHNSFILIGICFPSSPVHCGTTRHQFLACYAFSAMEKP